MSNTPEFPKPSRRDVLRPLELVGGAGIAGIFTGLIVLMVTRDLVLSAIFLGIAFIVVLVVLAMFALTFKPDDAEQAELDDETPKAPKPPKPGHE
ncbi:ABC transporter ATP-binding protein [Agromyces archimandritae]|uniref:ABC transporter ATP-binding protein n=1 Tax=Agromyces archimandritae TaxID=2781962 RepID=A0A975FJX9_9MICO|nr:ABC transporter ATP-binding protein [Agromyces archimandritae]QTX03312.1 ABC transporter ATP-binding protein [Agromyces archimandritae]